MIQKRALQLKYYTLIFKFSPVSLVLLSLLFKISTLDAQTFGNQNIIIQSEANGAYSIYSADLDGDGDQDILSASKNDNKIAWYENTDGNATFGKQQVITNSALSARSVYATDIDGDGDLDVLSASYDDHKIAWYENTDGNGNFGTPQIIAITSKGPELIYATDIDGDGDQDVLIATFNYLPNNSGEIIWYENTDGNGNFGTEQVIISVTDSQLAFYVADIDNDGDKDVLSASAGENKIAWYENTDGNGTFGAEQVISTLVDWPSTVSATDIDGDGDQDVLSAHFFQNGTIVWFENIDGNGTFGTQQVITTAANGTNLVCAKDIDSDGDQDVLSISVNSGDKIAWYENIDGNGTFGAQQIITTDVVGIESIYATDIDGDGDPDILSASFADDKIAWYENTNGNGAFGPQQILTITNSGPKSVYATDIDGDGDKDLLSAAYFNISWYENTDGNGTFGTKQIITSDVNNGRSVYASDIDGDGDQDVLSASYHDDKIAWYENTDGNGTFGAQQIITTSVDLAVSVCTADFDGDGDQDVLSASVNHRIAWYENTDGNGTFGGPQIITASHFSNESIYVADIDGDGDQDVLSASSLYDKIAWYENTDGSGAFGDQQVISTATSNPLSVYAADIDNDGDQDVLSTSTYAGYGGVVAWYENTDGNGTFGALQEIFSIYNNFAYMVLTTDIDKDGDQDVLSAFYDRIIYHENIDGNGTFGTHEVITTAVNRAQSINASDLDGDGDKDLISASLNDDKIAWYENLTIIGVEEENVVENMFTIFPNPTHKKVTIQTDENIQLIVFYNVLGEKVKQISDKEIDVTEFSAGTYFVKIFTDNGKIAIKKLVKF